MTASHCQLTVREYPAAREMAKIGRVTDDQDAIFGPRQQTGAKRLDLVEEIVHRFVKTSQRAKKLCGRLHNIFKILAEPQTGMRSPRRAAGSWAPFELHIRAGGSHREDVHFIFA